MDKERAKLFLLYTVGAAAIAATVLACVVLYTASAGEILYSENEQTDVYAYSGEIVTENGVRLTVAQPTTLSNSDVAAQPAVPRSEQVDINNAPAWELSARLTGIGDTLASRIVEYRELIGGFHSVEELIEVQGIGNGKLEKIRPYCYVGEYAQ